VVGGGWWVWYVVCRKLEIAFVEGRGWCGCVMCEVWGMCWVVGGGWWVVGGGCGMWYVVCGMWGSCIGRRERCMWVRGV